MLNTANPATRPEAALSARASSIAVPGRPNQAWEWMCQSGVWPEALDWVRLEVADAWHRCLEQYHLPLGYDAAEAQPCRVHRDDAVFPGALPLVPDLASELFEYLAETQASLVIADSSGRLVNLLDRGLAHSPPGRQLLRLGADWREEVLGNNGIGSALTLQKGVAFDGREHFSRRLHGLVTAGYPLPKPDGEALVLGVVSDQRGTGGALLSFLRLAGRILSESWKQHQTLGEPKLARESCPLSLPVSGSIPAGDDGLICDGAVQSLLDKAVMLQRRRIPLLISGESGTGKEYLVRYAHRLGPRRDRPLIALNCASIPKDLIESELFGYEAGSFTGARTRGKPGKFRLADGGILFLDEIGDMSFDLQATLLRALETGEFVPVGGTEPIRVDVQVIAATNVNLHEAIDRGTFRRDLYYRLNGARLHLPPLRERSDRLEIIQSMFVQELAETDSPVRGLCADVLRLFERHPWPGNLRQLRNVLRSALFVATGPALSLADLPPDFIEETHRKESCIQNSAHPGSEGSLAALESQRIKDVLSQCQGNMSRAARILGIARSTLYQKISRYGLVVS